MNANSVDLIVRFRDRGVIIDTNLLLVLIVGNVDRRLVGIIGKTSDFSRADYDRLLHTLEQFSRFIILPHILTEVGNMLKRNCPTKGTLDDLHMELARFVALSSAREARVLSRRVVAQNYFPEIGYADTAILTTAADRFLVLTNDGPLQGMAFGVGVEVLPFQWLRDF